MSPDKIIIRSANKDDAYAVQVLRNHAWQARYLNPESGITKELLETKLAPLPPTKADLEYYESMIIKPANRDKNLVAVLNSQVIGTIFYDELEGGEGDIGVFVADEFNGKGIGDKLLNALIAKTENPLRVAIFAKNSSREFYKSHGFAEDGEASKHYFNEKAYLPVQVLRLNRR